MSIFGYSQYTSASQIEVNIIQSELLNKNEKGSDYIELQFVNPILLILTAGETEFFIIENDEMIGKGKLESFTLKPLDSSFVKGVFNTDSDGDKESKSIKITGVTKYDVLFTSIDVPFVYYPTEEQAMESMDFKM
ncbi:MAG: hypothetical protein ACRBB5_01175, partial [Nitrosopumilus sp.]